MQIFKTFVTTGGGIHKADTIRHDGKLWLVPNWLDTPDGKWTMPTRIIRMDTLPHAPFGVDQFVLNDPLPKSLSMSAPRNNQ
jgi:hypothetical protein